MSKSLLFTLLPAAWDWALGKGSADEQTPLPCHFTLVSDFGSVLEEGQALLEDLPASERLVWLLPESFVSFHSVTLPRLRAAQQRAALLGALEEHLLGEAQAQSLHLVIAAAAEGAARWVAVCERAPLLRILARCAQSGRIPARIVPRLAPAATPETGSVFVSAHPLSAALCRVDGCAFLPLDAMLATQWAQSRPALQWRAQPAALASLQSWLGNEVAVTVLSAAERDLLALENAWDLSEGLASDLWQSVPLLRRLRRIWRDGLQALRSAAWRPVRAGALSLLILWLLGLNIAAWHEQRWQRQARAQIAQLAQNALPELGAVLNLDLQTQRLLQTLRLRAGVVGRGELEWWLTQIALAAERTGAGPPERLRFEEGRLELSFARAQEAERLARDLAAAGLGVTLSAPNQITLSLLNPDGAEGKR